MRQHWNFQKRIISTNSFAAVPVILKIDEHIARVYYSSRNTKNQSIPYFVDYNLKDNLLLSTPQKLGLFPGKLGEFDDSGVMPSSVVRINTNKIYLYYVGWNLGVTVPFRNSIGLAVSNDNGNTFSKLFNGPVLDRTHLEPHFSASNDVIIENNQFRIWYLSCIKWERLTNETRHYYHIKTATSQDGIVWKRTGKVAIDFKYDNEYAISVPTIIKENNIYKMWYSFRGGPSSEKYTIGYAESLNGEDWVRKDNLIYINRSGDYWDEKMICYPRVFKYNNEKYMLYNGNAYGKTGIGILKLLEKS